MKEPVTREEFEQLKKEMRKFSKQERKPKKVPTNFKMRMAQNRSLKAPEQVLMFYLNQKGEIEGPFLTKIYGGNFLVHRNQVFRFKPSKVWRWGRYRAVLARAFDRELVGMEDYEKIFAKGSQRSTINDPVQIKAVIGAYTAQKMEVKKNIGLIIALGIAAAIAIFWLIGRGGGGG